MAKIGTVMRSSVGRPTHLSLVIPLLVYAFTLMIALGSWGFHGLSYYTDNWFPTNSLDEVRKFGSVKRGDSSEFSIQDERLGNYKILFIESEPEFTIYLDERNRIVSAQMGFPLGPTLLFSPQEILLYLYLLFLAISLLKNNSEFALERFSFLGTLSMSYLLINGSIHLLAGYPIDRIGLSISLLLLVMGLLVGLFATLKIVSLLFKQSEMPQPSQPT